MSRVKQKKLKDPQYGSFVIEREDLEWLQDKVREGKFKSISEGIRVCVNFVRLYLETNKDWLQTLERHKRLRNGKLPGRHKVY